MPTLRNDQFVIGVSIDGAPVPGDWAELDGFDPSRNSLKFRNADGSESELGGPLSVDDGTVAREYDPVRDDYHGWNNTEHDAVVTSRGRDASRNPYGAPIVFSGKVLGATLSTINRDGAEVRMITLHIGANSTIG